MITNISIKIIVNMIPIIKKYPVNIVTNNIMTISRDIKTEANVAQRINKPGWRFLTAGILVIIKTANGRQIRSKKKNTPEKDSKNTTISKSTIIYLY